MRHDNIRRGECRPGPAGLGAMLLLALAACSTAVPQTVAPSGGALPANGAWEGSYQGMATQVSGSRFGCEKEVAISDFHVTANRVTYGSYYGVVRPDGTLVLESDGPVIQGRFDAGRFTGSVATGRDGCAYSYVAARVGP